MATTSSLTAIIKVLQMTLKSPRGVLVVTILAAWLAWELLALSRIFLADIFLSTFTVVGTLALFLSTREFYEHALITLNEVAIAYPIGMLIGIVLGVLMGGCRPLGEAIEPYITGLMATPRIIWFPVALMIFGSGIGSKVALGALGAFFPTVLNTYAGMLRIRPIYIQVGRVFRITPLGMLWKIYMPSLLRPILVGSRIALGVCITPVLLSEIKGSSIGLGYLIIEYYNHFQIKEMYAVLTFIFVVIASVNWVISSLIKFTSRGMPRHGLIGSAGSR